MFSFGPLDQGLFVSSFPGSCVGTSGNDFTARLWNAKTGKLIHKLVYEPRDHLDKFMKTAVTNATFCNMESQVFSRCYDGTWLWDAASGRVIEKLFYGGFSEHEPRFITQTEGVVAFYKNAKDMSHPHQEEPLQTLHLTKTAQRPEFADGGSSLIIQANDEVIRWNLATDRKRTIERQQRDYEIKTATRLDQSGRLLPLSREQWQRLAGEVSP
jgi:hypothetical protein